MVSIVCGERDLSAEEESLLITHINIRTYICMYLQPVKILLILLQYNH